MHFRNYRARGLVLNGQNTGTVAATMIVKKQGAKWTFEDEAKLRELARSGAHLRSIAVRLRRTENSIKKHARDMGVAVKPPPRANFRIAELMKAYTSSGRS